MASGLRCTGIRGSQGLGAQPTEVGQKDLNRVRQQSDEVCRRAKEWEKEARNGDYIGVILGFYLGFIGIVENKMETTTI